MAISYARGKEAKGECDQCGLTFKLSELRKLVTNQTQTNIKVCPDCWVPDHPQLQIGKHRVVDPQALFEPRPDARPSDMRNIAWGWNPVYAVASEAQIGTVIVSTP